VVNAAAAVISRLGAAAFGDDASSAASDRTSRSELYCVPACNSSRVPKMLAAEIRCLAMLYPLILGQCVMWHLTNKPRLTADWQ
jgi:hypothetical protein